MTHKVTIRRLATGVHGLDEVLGGGIPELARKYGIGFRDNLAEAAKRFISEYARRRNDVLTRPPSGDGMCLAYREIIQRVLAEV